MTITLTLTAEQTDALQRTLDSTGSRTPVEDFAESVALDQINLHAKAWAIRKAEAATEEIRKYADKLTESDIAEIKAVAEKYKPVEPEPTPVEPAHEEPIKDEKP
jgi:hypothetical protein